MADQPTATHQDIRDEPDERLPLPLTFGLGLHYTMSAVVAIAMVPAMMMK